MSEGLGCTANSEALLWALSLVWCGLGGLQEGQESRLGFLEPGPYAVTHRDCGEGTGGRREAAAYLNYCVVRGFCQAWDMV